MRTVSIAILVLERPLRLGVQRRLEKIGMRTTYGQQRNRRRQARPFELSHAGSGAGLHDNEATHQLMVEDPGLAVCDSMGWQILAVSGARGCYESDYECSRCSGPQW
jgi:hypothetical protein